MIHSLSKCILSLHSASLWMIISPSKFCTFAPNASLSQVAWSSSAYPRLGSLCRVRVCLKANLDETGCPVSDEGDEKLSICSDQPITELTEVPARAFQRCQSSVLQVPLDDWTMLRLGEGQCDITEACVEGMRAEEQCEVKTVSRDHRINKWHIVVGWKRHISKVLTFQELRKKSQVLYSFINTERMYHSSPLRHEKITNIGVTWFSPNSDLI